MMQHDKNLETKIIICAKGNNPQSRAIMRPVEQYNPSLQGSIAPAQFAQIISYAQWFGLKPSKK